MGKKLIAAGAVLLLLAFVALPVSAAVCPNPDCPNPDCPENKYQYRGEKAASQETVSAVCPNADCTPNDYDYNYDYLGPGPHRSGRNR